MLEDLEPRGVSATAECCCAEAGVGLVSPLLQSAQTTKAQNLFSVQQGKAIQPAIVQKGHKKLRSGTGKNATRSQSSHGQNKLSKQRQQKQAKGGNTVCFGSKLCVCVSPLVMEVVSVFVSQQMCLLCATGQASGDCV